MKQASDNWIIEPFELSKQLFNWLHGNRQALTLQLFFCFSFFSQFRIILALKRHTMQFEWMDSSKWQCQMNSIVAW